MNRYLAATAILLSFSVTACQPFFPVNDLEVNSHASQQRATLKVSLDGFQPKITQSAFGVQALPVYAIKFARVEVTGYDMVAPISTVVPIGGGQGLVDIPNVPLGKNRVVTATGLSAKDPDVAVPGAVVRDVITVNPGDNAVSLTWPKTPAAEVFASLLAQNMLALAGSIDANQVKTLSSNMLGVAYGITHPSLVDSAAIAQSIISNGTVPAANLSFAIAPATLTLEVKGLASAVRFDAWVDDPASGVKTNLSNGIHQISGIKPGTWRLHVNSDADFGHIEKQLTIARTPATTVTIDFSGTARGNIDYTNDGSPAGPNEPSANVPDPTSYSLVVTP